MFKISTNKFINKLDDEIIELFISNNYSINLKYYEIFMLMLVAHRYVFDNKCILSILEYKLKK